ncbi:MAG: hypothetical protein ACPGYV_05105 [Phycisphaeraceae bacterium]
MKIRIAIVAIVIASTGTQASATYGGWGEWRENVREWRSNHKPSPNGNAWGHWHQSSKQERKQALRSWLQDIVSAYKAKQEERWGSQADENSGWNNGRDCEKPDKSETYGNGPKQDRGEDCDPKVTGVPTPTAALGGLAMAGVMIGRRRRA